jgi:HK97 gp10 family phage protein
MATAKMYADDDFEMMLGNLGDQSGAIAKKAVYAGAKIVADRMKVNLQKILSPAATGKLVDALGITPIKQKNGEWSAKVGFDGYDNNGVAFQLIARALESGTSTRPAKPFARPTLNQTRKQVVAEMNRVINEEIQKIIK